MFYPGGVTPPVPPPCAEPDNIVYADELTGDLYDVVAGTRLIVPLGYTYSLAAMNVTVRECAILEVYGTMLIDGFDLNNYGTVIVHDEGGMYINGGNYNGLGGSYTGGISIS